MTNKPTGYCTHCCGHKTIVAKGLCMACYQYRRRHGHDRPEHVQIPYNRRWLQRKMEAELYA